MSTHENPSAPEKEPTVIGHPADSPATETTTAPSEAEALRAQLAEEKNKYLYLFAEFENYKKRMVKERSDAQKFGWEPVAREILGVMDNLERALAHLGPSTDKNLADGLHMILGQFRNSLEKFGVVGIAALGQSFDPNLHEAVGQEPSEQPVGTVTREMLKGFTLHGRLLRPAQVVISLGPTLAKS